MSFAKVQKIDSPSRSSRSSRFFHIFRDKPADYENRKLKNSITGYKWLRASDDLPFTSCYDFSLPTSSLYKSRASTYLQTGLPYLHACKRKFRNMYRAYELCYHVYVLGILLRMSLPLRSSHFL